MPAFLADPRSHIFRLATYGDGVIRHAKLQHPCERHSLKSNPPIVHKPPRMTGYTSAPQQDELRQESNPRRGLSLPSELCYSKLLSTVALEIFKNINNVFLLIATYD